MGEPSAAAPAVRFGRGARWAVVLGASLAVLAMPVPTGITTQAWRLLAIFVFTVTGLMIQPLPGGAMVLIGISTTAVSGVLTPQQALAGYGDPIVWLVLAAFFMSRGMLKTGLGRRIAFWFIRAIGRHSLGLGYALAASDLLLASFIPSNGARAGGIVFPIAKSLAETYESRPGPTARRLGAFLMSFLYQCDVMASATFLTGQASNVLIARLAHDATGLELTYARWLAGAVVPALVAFGVVPMLVYRLYPPEVRETPRAAEIAGEELRRMGRLGRDEWLMLATFALVAVLWMTTALHGINYAVVALIGISGLLVSGVLDWDDLTAERGAWEVFIWYGGMVRMAEALGESGITQRFAQAASGMTAGWPWWLALAALLLVYFYSHYAFASITAHATAMFTPFLLVILAAGAPPWLAVLLLAYSSNLMAALTHYGTTPGPIYFGAGYVPQWTWWRLGFVASVANLVIWTVVGGVWWKALGWW
jgi:divalent anion:Na+ symporter, DASS family